MIRDEFISTGSDIAIIGYAARFPGAENAAQFWDNLSHGVESIRAFSAEELESAGVSKSVARHPDYVRAGAPLSHLDAFDNGFFGLSPREAAIMDPQQRLFLESAWEALEHAGYAPGTFVGSTGVFAGSGPNSYLFNNLLSDPDLVQKEGIFLLRHTGNDKDVLATRVSYQLNLRGPSINVQTACSTSLVAVHLACQNLLHFGCDMALAGAVSIEIPHAIGYQYRPNEIQSQDGHCRAFDASATGTVFGSGLGIVVLRRLSEAITAGDTIHAVIKGSAVNNDGNRKVGFFAPSAEGQVEVILEALGAAGVEPASIDYVETHGTGTPIGDPIELRALDQVFANRTTSLNIGSVKTNLGHLDTAAGMAGLLKTILALGHRAIPATLHFQTLNPLVDAGQTKLRVVDRLTEWNCAADSQTPRRAGVTALGIGGTNAHLILEEPPTPALSQASRPVRLVTLSAKSAEALDAATSALAGHLHRFPGENLDDIAYTLHCGRREFSYRRMFVARDHPEALRLAELPDSQDVITAKTSESRPVAFLFSGQGTQYVAMGQELYRTEPLFRKWIDTCAALSQPHLDFDFREILYPSTETAAHAAEQIKLTWNAQPILFAIEYALAQLWISWGIRPAKLIGHSLGEYSAACLSGIFTLEDALSLVCARGNLMKKVAEGAMLAVSQSELEVTPWIHEGLSLAAVNSAEQCVLSGSVVAITALQEELARKGIATHRLETSHAFHSPAIDPILALFTETVAKKQLHAPQIPIVSNVTGTWLTDDEAQSPEYWARHFRETVRFHDGLATLQTGGNHGLLEIGPGEALATLSRQRGGKESRQTIFPSLPRPTEKAGDLGHMLFALGSLWVQGIAVDWAAFHANDHLRRVPLPTYSFQRKNFWIGPKIGTNWLGDSPGKIDDWFYRTTWKQAQLPAAASTIGPWLLFGEASHQALAVELRKQKAAVLIVVAGDSFRANGDNSYAINPASASDYILLLDHLNQRKLVPRQIVHLWSLTPSESPEDFYFHSLLFLIQALGARMPDQPIALTAISQRSVSIHGEPVLHPYGSLLIGPCRVAPLESPKLRCRQVDIDSTDPASLAALIRREGESDAAVSLAVYREGQRWTQDVERFHLEPAGDRVRERGTYLITGGLGGLGMAVADWLARVHHARLILLSRQADAQSGAHQNQFDEWRKLGAEVLVLTADVTNRESLRQALAAAREKFGPLNGIIHAAGILQDGIIPLKEKSTAHDVLAPKIEGVRNLDELTREQPLDFFALFSSVSALTPPAGQVDYCSANAFLNAFAQSRPADRNFIVIGWGPWAQTGMVAPGAEPVMEPTTFHHPLLDHIELDTTARTIYSGTLSVERDWVLGEHRFHGGESLLPGTAHLEMAVTALWKKIGHQPVTLEDIVFQAPLKVAPQRSCIIHAELRKAGAAYRFTVSSDDVVYFSGLCRPAASRPSRMNLKEIAGRCPIEKRDSLENIRQRGHFDFGPRWNSVRRVAFGKDQCLALVELAAEFRAETQDFALHPALLDVATGVALYLIPDYDKAGAMLLPFAYQRLTVYQTLPARLYSHARMHPDTGSDLLIFDLTLTAENGEVIAEIEGFTVKRLRNFAELARMESDFSALTTHAESHGEILAGIPTKEGIEALRCILKSHITDIVYVSPTALTPAASMKDTIALGDTVTAPSDDIDLVLEQLWQRLLGLDEVDAQTDFFDSGGHSLLAVRLFTEIRQRFKIDFGLSTLFEARTLGALAELIRKARDDDTPQKSAASAPALVALRPNGGTTAPLFLIHDVGGSVLRYEHLARHFPDNQAIYAIESRGLRGLRADYTVEEMARHYLVQIRERQPRGPYYVAGHSFGGLVAYEIARQLTAQNEIMGLVGLLDTFQRGRNEEDALLQVARPAGKLPLLKRLLTDLRAIILGRDRIGYLQERKTYIRAWAVKTTYRSAFKLSTRLGWRMPAFLNDVKEANWIASDYFTPGSYDGEVILFRCQHRLGTDPPDSSRVWQRMARDGVVIIDVPGDHNSMLREPNVQILAGQILAYFKPITGVTTETAAP